MKLQSTRSSKVPEEMELKTIIPLIEDLIKPSETDLRCIYDSCEKTFKHRQALNMHLTVTHKLSGYGDFKKKTQKVSYLCPVESCVRSHKEKGFLRFQTLKQHYVNIHSEKSHACDACEKRYSSAKQLTAHMESCGKVFTCAICHTPYSSKQVLAKHQQSQHPAAYRHAKYLISENGRNQLNAQQSLDDEKKINKRSDTNIPEPIRACDEGASAAAAAKPQTIIVINVDPNSVTNNEMTDTEQQAAKANPVRSRVLGKSSAEQMVRLLPKPINCSTSQQCSQHNCDDNMDISHEQTMGWTTRESSSTQTDIMNEAVRHSGITLDSTSSSKTTRSISTMTDPTPKPKAKKASPRKTIQHSNNKRSTCRKRTRDGNTQSTLFLTSNETSTFGFPHVVPDYHSINQAYPGYVFPPMSNTVSLATGNQSSLTPWCDESAYEPLSCTHPQIPQHHINPLQSAEFGTQVTPQQTMASQTASNTDLGTQTMLSAILEGMGTSSIELQCELGNQSLVDNAMSFGTQTFGTQTFGSVSESEIEPSISQIEMSSFGTQTAVDTQTSSLQLPKTPPVETTPTFQPIPLHQSTSDFAMQFPYNMMDFGTQTPIPATDFSANEFTFDDDLVDAEVATGSSVILSQSSTQTDLEFLLNNIQTQTESLF